MKVVFEMWLPAVATLLAFAGAAFGDDGELLPGYLTDASAGTSESAGRDGYVTPAHLRDPYVSTYYVEPTVSEGERVRIRYYATDWEHSLRRFADNRARLDVAVRYSKDLVHWQKQMVKSRPSGDGEFDLGPLSAGDWVVAVQSRDCSSGLRSHVVWQEFRVLPASERTIPADKVYRMTEADLAAYGIRNDGDYERLVKIEVPTNSPAVTASDRNVHDQAGREAVVNYRKSHPHVAAKRPGYAVYVPSVRGEPLPRAFAMKDVVYDSGYDRAAVEAASERTLKGLQRFLDDKAAAGFRKVVLLPGTYRVSGKGTLQVPNRVRLDLNGATIKMNALVGEKAMIVALTDTEDAALENGIVEGDYYEHDYQASPGHSEWVCGWNVCGASRDCEVRNIELRNVTGYGGNNGRNSKRPGDMCGYSTNDTANVIGLQNKADWVRGALRSDGTIDESDAFCCTSRSYPVASFQPFHFLTVSYGLGYQGIRTHGWNLTAAYYDARGKCIYTERIRQYRIAFIPPAAETVRFTAEVGTPEEAAKSCLSMYLMRLPVNCAVKKCRFERVRCVGYALFECRNHLIEDCTFTHSGEDLANCAFDAEDGWDRMQDVTIRRNDFHDNPANELLTCCGHNFIIEQNRCRLHLWERSNSFCVRSNDLDRASFGCGFRHQTGYWRYDGNTFRRRLDIGGGHVRRDWDVVVADSRFTSEDPAKPFEVRSGATGVFRNCTFIGVKASPGAVENCRFENCDWNWSMHNSGTWRNCTAKNCRFPRVKATNLYERCTFTNVRFDPIVWSGQYFRDCTLEDFTMVRNMNKNVYTGAVVRCVLKGKTTLAKDTAVDAATRKEEK